MRLRLSVAQTTDVLGKLHADLWNCRNLNDELEKLDHWMNWWWAADVQFRTLFTDGDVAASLAASQANVARNVTSTMWWVLNREMDVWLGRLTDMISELRSLQPFIERPGQIVVPDTSAFLEGEYFTDLDWQALAGAGAQGVRLVVPVLVVEELDAHKRGRDRQRERAVSVLRRLWELGGSDPDRIARIPGKRVTVEVFLDEGWHVRRPVNDDEIIERALVGEIVRRPVVLAAADFAMLYRASAAGLNALLVPRPGGSGGNSTGSLGESAH